MFKKHHEYIAVRIDEQATEAAIMSAAGKAVLRGVVHLDGGSGDPGKTTDLLRAAMQKFGIKKGSAVCVISSNMITSKNIEIPSLDPEEIRSIIDLQAGRHTPLSREEILVGYVCIGVFQRNYTKVLLLIANRTAINAKIDIMTDAGLHVEHVFFGPECAAHFYRKGLSLSDDAPVAIIDVARDFTDFTVACNQTIATCRNIPIGLSHFTEDREGAKERLVQELVTSLESYESEDINDRPARYILVSDNPAVSAIAPQLQEKFGTAVDVIPYYQQLERSPEVSHAIRSTYHDVSFLGVVSASAMDPDDAQIDLVPDELLTQRAIQEKGRQVIWAAVYATVLLVLICAFFFSKVYLQSLYLKKLEREYTQKKRMVVVLDKVAHRTRILKDFLNDRLIGLEVMEELYRLVPEEIYLQNVFMDEDGVVNIQGISASMSRVFDLVGNLEDSELFKGVKTRSTTAKKDRGKDAAAFDIVFQLESTQGDLTSQEEPPQGGAEE
ncbi:MAG: PilN domain-containing protein [Candidatus Omnitrophota bacterium]